jgi:hypothetical protein
VAKTDCSSSLPAAFEPVPQSLTQSRADCRSSISVSQISHGSMHGLVRLVLNTLTYGPLLNSAARYKMSSETPLDPVENWTFWTEPKNGMTKFLIRNYGSSRINVIFPLFENQHFIYLRLSMVITIWIYSDLTEMSVVIPPNP